MNVLESVRTSVCVSRGIWSCLDRFWLGLVVSNRVWLVSGRCLLMVCFTMLQLGLDGSCRAYSFVRMDDCERV
jgi:hypothetical protein